jgi:hypothetical protein
VRRAARYSWRRIAAETYGCLTELAGEGPTSVLAGQREPA